MSRLVVIYPGSKSDLLSLQDVLRESHVEQQQERAREIEARKKIGVPLDDNTDWQAVRDAVAVGDSALVARLTSGNALEPLPDFVVDPDHAEVCVRFVALAESMRQDRLLAVSLAQRAVVDAGDDAVKARGANEARDQALLDFIQAAVDQVRVGDELVGDDGINDEQLEALRATGLMVPLYLAARDYQRLSPGKGVRFGSRAPST